MILQEVLFTSVDDYSMNIYLCSVNGKNGNCNWIQTYVWSSDSLLSLIRIGL